MTSKLRRIIAYVLIGAMIMTMNVNVFAVTDTTAVTEPAVTEETTEPVASEPEESVTEETTETVTETGTAYHINPVYSGEISSSDLNGVSEYAASPMSDPEYLTDETAVIDAIREAMTERVETFTLYYTKDSDLEEDFLDEWIDMAIAETGAPDQGDYLKFQYGGCEASYGTTIYSTGKREFDITFTFTYYTTAEQEAAVDDKVADVLNELGLPGEHSEYETTKLIYDYICNNVDYDNANLENKEYKLKYTAYAALIDKTAVCQGYANLLYRLLREAGVDVRIISGIGNGGPHAWNIIKLGSKYYCADSTWDRSCVKAGIDYKYFLKGADNFTDHENNAEYTTAEFTSAYPVSAADYEAAAQPEEDLVTSGTCGDNLTWTLDEEGTLTISGTGDMYDWEYAPWSEYCDKIKTVKIAEGVTSIGDNAFYAFEKLTGELVLPQSVKSIGEYAFFACNGLTGNLVIPDGVTSIGQGAFEQCSGFTGDLVIPNGVAHINMYTFADCSGFAGNLIIPEGVTSIGDFAFAGSSSITGDLELPAGLTSVGDSAFALCVNLTGMLVIPDGMTSINSNAFDGCRGLSEVVIPEGVTTIDSAAFYACSGLSQVIIPESVTTIETNAFTYCNSLVIYGIAGSYAQTYAEENNILFEVLSNEGGDEPEEEQVASGTCGDNLTWALDEEGTLTISGTGDMYDWEYAPWYEQRDKIKTVEIAEGVTSIESNAFYAFEKLTGELVLPQSINSIGSYAFYACSGLTGSLIIPDGVQTIGGSAFSDCSGLTKITIPDSVTSLGGSAFAACTGLTGTLELPAGITNISTAAFGGCSGLAEVIIQDGVTTIGADAFGGCHVLVKITIPESVTSIDDYAFRSCKNLVIYGVAGSYAQTYAEENNILFEVLSNEGGDEPQESLVASGTCGDDLTWKLDEEGTLTISGTGAMTQRPWLEYKDALKTLVIEDGVTTISSNAFYGCSGLTGSLTIPDSVTEIGAYAFRGCSGLTGELIFPDSVTKIGESAFYGCSGLTGELSLPTGLTKIGNSAFYGCSGLTGSLIIPDSVATIESFAFSGCRGLTGELNLPTELITIKSNAFRGCSGLTGSLTIPDSVTEIGSDAFYGCSGLTGSLTIPDSVTEIGSSAFCGCSGLTGELNLPPGLTSIGQSTFKGCSGLTGELNLPSGLTSIGYSAFSGCSGLTGELNLPPGLTSIGFSAFSDCSGLTGELNLPPGLTKIENGVFSSCSGLTGELLIPESVTEIGSSAFSGCSGLTGSLTVPDSVITIGYSAFSGCSGLTGELNLPSGLTSIGQSAFSGCSGLTGELNLPSGLTSIGFSAFSGCSGLTGELNLPPGLTSIGFSAFKGCSGLTGELNLPPGLTKIENGVFYSCSGLTGELIIPDSVTEIGDYAFYGCSGLIGELNLPPGLTKIGNSAFYGCSGLTETLVIPQSVTEIEESSFNQTKIEHIFIPDSVTVYEGDSDAVRSGRTYHIYPGSAADKYFKQNASKAKIEYLMDPEMSDDTEYLTFISGNVAIVAGTSGIVDIMDLLVCSSDISVEDLVVTISDPSKAIYDNGSIAGVSAGECSISVTAGDITAETVLKITDEFTNAEAITFEKDIITLGTGEHVYNQPVIMPLTASVRGLTWSSSEPAVAEVDERGNVSAGSTGTAVITASYGNGISGSYTVNVDIQLKEIVFAELYQPKKIILGESVKINYYLYPYNYESVLKTQYSSDNEDVAVVDENGYVTAVGCGSAKITVVHGEVSKTLEVLVHNPLRGISIKDAPGIAYNGETVPLELNYDPVNADNIGTVEWRSDNEKIATVDDYGTVTITGAGIVTITAAVNGFTAEHKFICPEVMATELQLNRTELTLSCHETATLEAIITPANVTQTLTWSSNNEAVAAVDQQGHVTTAGVGTAEILAKVGNVSANCIVTVDHINLTKTNAVSPTCTDAGNIEYYTCKCGKLFSDANAENEITKAEAVIGKLGHIELVKTNAVSPTCTDAGNIEYYTCKCGKLFSDAKAANEITKAETVLEKLGHTEETLAGSEPTCTVTGLTAGVKCSVCGETITAQETVPATGHVELIKTNAVSPTCTAAGNIEYYTCKCGKLFSDAKAANEITKAETVLEKLGHTEETLAGSEPTCTATGLTAGVKCTVCGETITAQETVPATGHVELTKTNAVSPTCTAAGNIEYYTCKCGAVFSDANAENKIAEWKTVLGALGHSMEYIPTVPPTCTEDGVYSGEKCSVCGEVSWGFDVWYSEGHRKVYYEEELPSYKDTGLTKGIWCSSCETWLEERKVIPKREVPVPADITISLDKKTGKPLLLCRDCPGVFEVYRSTSKTGTYTLLDRVTDDSHQYLDKSAVSGKTYYYKVKSIMEEEGAESKLSEAYSIKVKALVPTGLKCSNRASDGKITVSWSKVDGAEKYKIYRAASSGGTYSQLTEVTGTSYTDTTAKAGSTYYYKIAAVVSGNTSAKSGYVSRTCDVARPTGVTSTNRASDGKITVKWDKVAGAREYHVYRAASADGTYKFIEVVTETSYTDTSAVAGNKYYYKVVAGSEITETANSAKSAYTSRICDLARPVGVTSTNRASDGKITVKWNEVSGAAKYRVYRATSADGTYTCLVATTGTSYTDTRAKAGNKYYYKVEAVSSKTSSANSAKSTYTSRVCDLPRPTGVTSTNRASDGKITVKWNEVSGASKYNVYRSTSSGGTYTRLTAVTGTSYTDTTAKAGNKYYYKVDAVSSKTSSANSAKSAYISKVCALPRPALSISGTAKRGSLVLTWSKITGASKYYIYRATSKTGTYTKYATTTAIKYTDSSVKKGKTYYYKVKAVSSKTSSANSAFSLIRSTYVR